MDVSKDSQGICVGFSSPFDPTDLRTARLKHMRISRIQYDEEDSIVDLHYGLDVASNLVRVFPLSCRSFLLKMRS